MKYTLFAVCFVLLATFCQFSYVGAQCLTANDARMTSPQSSLAGIQKFNFDLFQQVYPSDPHENLIFSPYSIWNSLVLAYFGSGGSTKKQFEQVLNVNDKLETLRKWRHLETLYQIRRDTSEVNNTFRISNQVYFDNSVITRSCLQDILYNEFKKLDFRNNPNEAAKSVNGFVAEATQGHITEIVSPKGITFTHMALVNAAFFKGTWASRFDPENTTVQPFETLTGLKVNVELMSQFGDFRSGNDDAARFGVLGLPYAGEKIVMYVFLPYESGQSSFDAMVQSLSSRRVGELVSNLNKMKMYVFLPKFKLETVVEENLIKGLVNMGLREPFVKGVANFSEFSFDPDISLEKGIHKAFIDVNEEGTKAGAATAFVSNKILGNIMFICNRSFLFIIRDDQTENILFIGVLKSPSPVSRQRS